MSAEPFLDEDYASEEDSDFSPDAVAADEKEEGEEASESEDDSTEPAATTKRKRDATEPDNGEGDYENSGDELIISKGKKRHKKHKAKDGAANDDEGGEGGLIKTRSMRATEKAERKSHAVTGPVTVDVNDLWAQMMAGPVVPSKTAAEEATNDKQLGDSAKETAEPTEASKSAAESEAPTMIKIKRTYNFAGKVHTEEKMVPRDSAEAKVYLDSLGPGADEALALNEDEDEPSKRQPRKAFRSVFEPVIEGLTARGDLNLGVAARLQLREQAKAKKLNVVEKSRMDWAGFVDKAGIKDELQLAGKSKQSYTSRQDFLARVDAKRDDDARKARMAQRV
ncbi:bucentaur or craniofacial development-domain-containing protein [Apiospora marii]|uniref:SWR1-complex protein 5 n=1 Tax=Apiospora marii TaxID=335849 RepID=A0ABR1SNU2_9PEZI